jgi:hypothetical protein
LDAEQIVMLQEWAYVSEIIASIAVIASLVYLGIQLRDGNREARARTIQAAMDSEAAVGATLARYASTWEKVVTGQKLADGEEVRRGILLFNLLMTESENRYQQFNSGYLDAASWQSRRSSLARLVHLPIFQMWRKGIGALKADLALIDVLSMDTE